jgi:CubicO group peptidase (beta-lactamase class C family)
MKENSRLRLSFGRLALFVLMTAFSLDLIAEKVRLAKPESVGVSSQRLKLIDDLVARKLESGELVGAVSLVSRRGKIVYFNAAGYADAEAKKPMQRDTIFRIFSMTKAITTTAAMMLYEEGHYQLFDPVEKYLPELAGVKVYVETDDGNGRLEEPRRPMTIADLMMHTSGMTYGIFGNSEVDKKVLAANLLDRNSTTRDMVEKLGKLPLFAHPGEHWQYGVSTDVLGELVTRVSGKPLDEFFAERIFKPLEMVDTGFSLPEEKLGRFPVNYRWGLDGKREIAEAASTSTYLKKKPFLSGGGGLVGSTTDYLKFCQMILNDGEFDGQRLLSPKSVQLMGSNHIRDHVLPESGVRLGDGNGFGLGFRVRLDVPDTRQLGSPGTISWGGVASTMYFIDPKEDLIGLIMTQKLPTDLRIRDEFTVAVYQSLIEISE